ncbi:hypothetical protein [Bradyrhizobium sp.]|jgi:hypothetical protein|nr:hypothetical protein [Bradyrhizobium sp.]HZR75835.1 hypothetical protein [Bradyrhizobium sp.]
MSNISIATGRFSSKGTGFFNQIALFSASGLAMSMALVVVGGLQILYPCC